MIASSVFEILVCIMFSQLLFKIFQYHNARSVSIIMLNYRLSDNALTLS